MQQQKAENRDASGDAKRKRSDADDTAEVTREKEVSNDQKANLNNGTNDFQMKGQNVAKMQLPLRKKLRLEAIHSSEARDDASKISNANSVARGTAVERTDDMIRAEHELFIPTTIPGFSKVKNPNAEGMNRIQMQRNLNDDKLSLIASLCDSRENRHESELNNDVIKTALSEVSDAGVNEKLLTSYNLANSAFEKNKFRSTAVSEGNDEHVVRQMIAASRHSSISTANSKDQFESFVTSSRNSKLPTNNTSSASSSKKTSYRFPVKLMKVLSCGKYDDVISWTPDGKAFVIHNQTDLVEKVLPLNDFKGVKYSSFTRKLHRWGFVKILRGGGDSNHRSAYFHKNFQRGNFPLCHDMRCSGKGEDDELLHHQYNTADDSYLLVEKGVVIPYASHETTLDPRISSIGRQAAGETIGSGLSSYPPGSNGPSRSLDDTLKILQAERELLLIDQQRKLLREEEERRLFATTSPYGIAGLNYLNALRQGNPDSLLQGLGGLSNSLGQHSLHGTSAGILDGVPSSSILPSRGGSMLGPAPGPGAGPASSMPSQEDLFLASAARREHLQSLINGGILSERANAASLIPGYGTGSLSMQNTSTSIGRDSLNPSSSLKSDVSRNFDSRKLPKNTSAISDSDQSLATNLNIMAHQRVLLQNQGYRGGNEEHRYHVEMEKQSTMINERIDRAGNKQQIMGSIRNENSAPYHDGGSIQDAKSEDSMHDSYENVE